MNTCKLEIIRKDGKIESYNDVERPVINEGFFYFKVGEVDYYINTDTIDKFTVIRN
jgi:hypothetical protein